MSRPPRSSQRTQFASAPHAPGDIGASVPAKASPPSSIPHRHHPDAGSLRPLWRPSAPDARASTQHPSELGRAHGRARPLRRLAIGSSHVDREPCRIAVGSRTTRCGPDLRPCSPGGRPFAGTIVPPLFSENLTEHEGLPVLPPQNLRKGHRSLPGAVDLVPLCPGQTRSLIKRWTRQRGVLGLARPPSIPQPPEPLPRTAGSAYAGAAPWSETV